MAMDSRAKRRLYQAMRRDPIPNAPLSGERLRVTFQAAKQSRVCKKELYQEIYGKETKKWWVKKHNIPPDLVDDNIDWNAVDKAIGREPFGKRRWLAKHCAKQCGVGTCLLKRKHQTHNRCPRCDAPEEDTTHVVQCTARSAHIVWTKALTHLEGWLLNQDTNAQLHKILVGRLAGWQAKDPLQPLSTSARLREAIQEQDRIGWENFLLGRVSTKIRDFQQRHYEHQNSRKTGAAWCSKLINQLWLMIWKMWEHRNHINTSTITPQQRRERGQLLTEVRREFAKGRTTLLKEDHYLLENRDRIVAYPLQDLEDWLNRVQQARAANDRHVARESRGLEASRRVMQEWLAGHRGQSTTQRTQQREQQSNHHST